MVRFSTGWTNEEYERLKALQRAYKEQYGDMITRTKLVKRLVLEGFESLFERRIEVVGEVECFKSDTKCLGETSVAAVG